MTENGNKGGMWLLAIVLITALFCAAASVIYVISDDSVTAAAYRDPELSPALIRGSILDRNGRYLAIQAPDYGFSIHLHNAGAQEAAAFIAGYTEENAISVGNRIEKGESFIRITDLLDSDDFDAIMKELEDFQLSDDINPVSIERRRYFYPSFSMITGNVDSSMHGISGIELIFDSELSAIPETDSAISHGKDIRLTLDSDLQQELYDTMLVTARYGRAAILSPDGKVLAFYGRANEEELMSMVDAIGTEPFQAPAFPHSTINSIRNCSIYLEVPASSAPMVKAAINAVISRMTTVF